MRIKTDYYIRGEYFGTTNVLDRGWGTYPNITYSNLGYWDVSRQGGCVDYGLSGDGFRVTELGGWFL